MWRELSSDAEAEAFVSSIDWSDSDLAGTSLFWPAFAADRGIANYECCPSGWIGALAMTATGLQRLDLALWRIERFSLPLSLDQDPQIAICGETLPSNRRVSLRLNPANRDAVIMGAKLAVRVQPVDRCERGPVPMPTRWEALEPPWQLV